MAHILMCFHVALGLKVNFHKSKVFGIGVPHKICLVMLVSQDVKLPPSRMFSQGSWFVQIWLSNGIGNLLGKGSILAFLLEVQDIVIWGTSYSNQIIYWQPPSILLLNSLGGSEERSKINQVVQNVVLDDKDIGGLGVSSLKSLNFSIPFKWIWRLKSENNSLQSQAI